MVLALVVAGCSSTVSGTVATGDAALDRGLDDASLDATTSDDARDDARAAATDAPRVARSRNPCAADRVIDLDRDGLLTERGVGAILDLADAPETVIASVDGACAPIYRPVVLRLRAPRDGNLVVTALDNNFRSAGYGGVMTRCDDGGALFACAEFGLACLVNGSCGGFRANVRAGQIVEFALGLPARPPMDTRVPSRVAVTVAVVPSLPLGASCFGGPESSRCAVGLVCSPEGDPAWMNHCVAPAPPRCNGVECREGETCVESRCRRVLALGAHCTVGSNAACPAGSSCARRGDAYLCLGDGASGGACRAGDAPCDADLVCDRGGHCAPPAAPRVACARTEDCAGPDRCAPDNPPRCVAPGLSGGRCIERGTGQPECDPGLICERTGDTCVPALPEGAPCALMSNDAPECGPGLLCAGTCIRTGFEGARCSPIGRQHDCDPLTCIGYVCAQRPGAGERCTSLRACTEGLVCGRDVRCRSAGSEHAPCDEDAPRCDAGLACNGIECLPGAGLGELCAHERPCGEGLRCASREGEPARCLSPARSCEDGCADGTTCREGSCVVDGRCDRVGLTPQPCGEARRCVRVGDAVVCLADGARDGACRAGAAAPCDEGLVCLRQRCAPVLAEGAPCRPRPGPEGACGPGLICAPPDCVGPPTLCLWSESDDRAGHCQREVAPSTRAGDCVRGADGRAICGEGLGCIATSLLCAPRAAVGEPCNLISLACPEGLACANPPLHCTPMGGAGQPCRMSDSPCDAGLICATNTCVAVGNVGDVCGGNGSPICPNGTHCREATDRSSRCFRFGVENAPCDGALCAPGLRCVGDRCMRAAQEGDACVPAVTTCAEGLACSPGVAGPSTCRRFGARGAPCSQDLECDAGLRCATECVPVRYAGEACDAAGRLDACEAGFSCRAGVCTPPGDGEPCALERCAAGTTCVGGYCVRPRDPGEGCSPTDARTTCRIDSGCADGRCQLLGTMGAPCRRSRAAPACDAGLRCDLVADRCVP